MASCVLRPRGACRVPRAACVPRVVRRVPRLVLRATVAVRECVNAVCDTGRSCRARRVSPGCPQGVRRGPRGAVGCLRALARSGYRHARRHRRAPRRYGRHRLVEPGRRAPAR
ncbi:hypothetical protein B9W62_15340 [Streptomyces sp. CS113]|nr:hypothetical protein B9W62_15340 [Streptomyces sp. CS113]